MDCIDNNAPSPPYGLMLYADGVGITFLHEFVTSVGGSIGGLVEGTFVG